jgi:hypothetical protein
MKGGNFLALGNGYCCSYWFLKLLSRARKYIVVGNENNCRREGFRPSVLFSAFTVVEMQSIQCGVLATWFCS